MRGRSLTRIAAVVQLCLLAGALIVPSSVAAATLGFTLNTPTVSTLQYSDFTVLRGSYTCLDDGASNCPTTTQSRTATFSVRPSGGSSFLNVGTVTSSFVFTGSDGGCASTCTFDFELTWKAGRALTISTPPGVYDVGLTTTIAGGQQVLLGAITITQESTTTTYTGGTSGLGGTSLALSANVVDTDLGQVLGTGIIAPDANLLGSNKMSFQLFDATNTTSVVGPVTATVLSNGNTTGTPSLLLPAAGGTYMLRTTYLGNTYYTTSADLDTITVTGSNTPPVLTVPASPLLTEASSPLGAYRTFTVSATDAEDVPAPMPSCDHASGDLFPLGDTTVSCTVTDSGLLSDADSFIIRVIDTTDPVMSVTTNESDNGAGWFNVTSNDEVPGVTVQAVTADLVGVTSLTCTDNGVDVGSLDPSGDSFVIGDGSHDVSCTATDAAGNHQSDSASFDVDQTPPSISASVSPDAAGTGWWNIATGVPTVSYSCSDGGSGLASCSPPHLFGEGADQADTGTATDVAGNTGSASVSNIDVDLTAPSITASIALPDGGSGWWNIATGAPTVSYSCSDAGSGVASCSAPHLFAEGSGLGDTGTAVDNAGNSSTDSVSGVKVDLTAPSISASLAPAPAGTGWWNASTGAPTVTYSCSDSGSGLASCTSPHLFGEGIGQGQTGTAVDNAGNAATASVSNVKVDLTAPTSVAFTGGGVSNGGSYVFGSVPAGPSGCTASDAVSGVASCVVSGYSTAVGPHTITALATDNAGNSSTATRTYTVLPWTLVGFANPISMTSLNVVKPGATATLRFQVFAGAVELTSTSAIVGFMQTQISCTTLAPIASTTAAASSVKYAGQFQGRVDLPLAMNTCWRVAVVTADGSSLSATFQLK